MESTEDVIRMENIALRDQVAETHTTRFYESDVLTYHMAG